MTINKAKLKALAEAATQGERAAEMCMRGIPHVITDQWDIAEVCATEGDNVMADAEFIAATGPATVLALLAEISRIEIDAAYVMAGSRTRAEVIDQLKAENEKMRSFLADVSRTSGDKWAVMAARNLLKEFGHD
ncbi:hypothetical protein PAGU2196_11410 [Pseudomonas sp. PAGU 2196]|uniref:ead/Ea22-like family protein n=1 Tax=Pseudomonas sp. PAGU 2196 TaxID=2793997 RepID=UPI001EDD5225|nr:ead/Ea22-like family protein [Pseudomonas sp. PAGU 2196]GHS80307.1 hypothetical protein PAGU2196_11410 [Pseudomonas sp. PAGU 2196]